MAINKRFHEVLGPMPILGMVHLAGESQQERVKRALHEIEIYSIEGLDGAIVENYHGTLSDVTKTLQEIACIKPDIAIGVNILPNDFKTAFTLAEKYGASFIQLDHVAGVYSAGTLDIRLYEQVKSAHQDIVVLGGVWPKYYHPVSGSSLEEDLKIGMQRAEAIVVTGEGTGKETPLSKIENFRRIIGKHSLIVGAGLTPENAYKQLAIANGAIVGTAFKAGNNTDNPVDNLKVREFMDVVRQVRSEH